MLVDKILSTGGSGAAGSVYPDTTRTSGSTTAESWKLMEKGKNAGNSKVSGGSVFSG
jgi:hypothetical protein